MIYNKNKTFTGTDTLVFIIFPKTKPILLGSLTTLSYSIYRHKTPVPLLGRISTGGCTRGTRVVAGTMIFTVINQHWVNEISDHVPYIDAYKKIKADELPIFDLMIVSANEFGSSAAAFIYGVDFTEEAGVISIEDLMMENTFNFVARDIDVFANNDFNVLENGKRSTIDTIVFNSQKIIEEKFEKEPKMIQIALINKEYNIEVTNIYDNATKNAVKEFQERNGLLATGMVDSFTSNLLFQSELKPIINNKKERLKVKDDNGQVVDYIEYGNAITDYTIYDNKIIVKDGYINSNEIYDEEVEVKFNIENFENKISYIEMIKGYLEIEVITSNPTSIYIAAISVFNKDIIKVNKKHFSIEENTVLNSSLLSESFIYDIDNKSLPLKVEIIVKVNNEKHYKFIIFNAEE